MAIMLPFFMLLLLGVIDFCRVFYAAVAVTQAARAGTQYGAQNALISQSNLYSGMQTAATNVMTDYGLTAAGPVPTPAVQRYCVCSGTPPSCPASGSNTCPPSGHTCDTSYQIYLCTSTSYTFSAFAPISWTGIGGTPGDVTLNRISVMRVQ